MSDEVTHLAELNSKLVCQRCEERRRGDQRTHEPNGGPTVDPRIGVAEGTREGAGAVPGSVEGVGDQQSTQSPIVCGAVMSAAGQRERWYWIARAKGELTS